MSPALTLQIIPASLCVKAIPEPFNRWCSFIVYFGTTAAATSEQEKSAGSELSSGVIITGKCELIHGRLFSKADIAHYFECKWLIYKFKSYTVFQIGVFLQCLPLTLKEHMCLFIVLQLSYLLQVTLSMHSFHSINTLLVLSQSFLGPINTPYLQTPCPITRIFNWKKSTKSVLLIVKQP